MQEKNLNNVAIALLEFRKDLPSAFYGEKMEKNEREALKLLAKKMCDMS